MPRIAVRNRPISAAAAASPYRHGVGVPDSFRDRLCELPGFHAVLMGRTGTS